MRSCALLCLKSLGDKLSTKKDTIFVPTQSYDHESGPSTLAVIILIKSVFMVCSIHMTIFLHDLVTSGFIITCFVIHSFLLRVGTPSFSNIAKLVAIDFKQSKPSIVAFHDQYDSS